MTKKPIKFLVVEDHEFHLTSTVDNLKATYPKGIIHTASTYGEAEKELQTFEPDLLVLDLQIPLDLSEQPVAQNGVTLLEKILDREDSDSTINVAIVTQSPQALVRIKDKIHNYSHGGITATDKTSGAQILQDIHLALQGGSRINHIEALRSQQLKPNWYQVLQLAWYEELSDQAIADKMGYSLRNIRIFWKKIYDFFGIHCDYNQGNCGKRYEVKNRRIVSIKQAIARGFLDIEH